MTPPQRSRVASRPCSRSLSASSPASSGSATLPAKSSKSSRRSRPWSTRRLDTAINWIITKAKALFAWLFGGKKDKPDERTEAEKTKAKIAAIGEAEALVPEEGFEEQAVRGKLGPIKSKYKLLTLDLVVDSQDNQVEMLHFEASASDKVSGKEKKVKIGGDVMSPAARKQALAALKTITSPSQVNERMVALAKTEPGVLDRYKGPADGYELYLSGKKNGDTFLQPLAYLKQRAAFKSGKQDEAKWINLVYGVGKNSTSFDVKLSRSWDTVIPDYMTGAVVGDAKDWASLPFTDQLECFYMIAKADAHTGRVRNKDGTAVKGTRSFTLIVRSESHSEGKTHLSGNLLAKADTVHYVITDADVKGK